MAEVNFAKLVKLVKSGNNQAEAARQLGVTTGQLSMLIFSQAQVEAGVWGKIPATAASVKKARDGDSNRWELIAARTGESVARVKALYKESGGDPNKSYTGRGAMPGGAKKSPGKKTPAKANAKSGGRGKPAGRSKPAGKKTPARARTLAERRAARAGNPS
jgi:hypothetical protein